MLYQITNEVKKVYTGRGSVVADSAEIQEQLGGAECFISPNRRLHTAIHTSSCRSPERPTASGHPLECCLQQ